ncbi:MAG: alpha/beta hydrolase [Rubrivivax sp.]
MIPRRGRLLAALRAAAQPAAPLPEGIRIERDLAYGEHAAQALDLYLPAGDGPHPLVVFVHGGGWRRGDKAMPRMVQNKVGHWLPRGRAFASVNYRMLPEADVLAQAGDVARALGFLQRLAAARGLDAGRIALVGHSAGAHLVALLVADPPPGLARWQATVVIDTAALDMVAVMQRPHFGFYDPVFGDDPAYWRAASPTHRLQRAPCTPVLLVCSARRDDVLPAAEAFVDRARRLGGRARVLPVDLGHLEINDALGRDPAYTAAVDAFLDDPERESPQGGPPGPP